MRRALHDGTNLGLRGADAVRHAPLEVPVLRQDVDIDGKGGGNRPVVRRSQGCDGRVGEENHATAAAATVAAAPIRLPLLLRR